MNKKENQNLLIVLIWSIKQLVLAAPILVISYMTLLVLAGLMPGLSLYLLCKLTSFLQFGFWEIPVLLTVVWCLVIFIQGIMDEVSAILRIPLNEKLLVRCNVALMERANSLKSIIAFEESKYHDLIHSLKEGARVYPLSFVYTLSSSVQYGLATISIVAALVVVNPYLPFLVILASLPRAFSAIYREKKGWDVAVFRSPRARRMSWLSQLTLDEKAIKDIRAYGCGAFLVQRYKNISDEFLKNSRKERLKSALISLSLSLLTVLGNMGVLLWVLSSISNALPVAFGIVSLQALIMAQQNLPMCVEAFGAFSTPLLFFQKLNFFLNTSPPDFTLRKNLDPSEKIKEIAFEQVSFYYPDGRQALDSICFKIDTSECWALVGENGSGKSTIVKLLSRLYDPSSGRILVNGIDLRDINVDLWRQKLGLVFQDCTNYSLTPRENIGLGNLLDKDNHRKITKAASLAGFDKIAQLLPKGLDTFLGKEFGGTTLSGGQWQSLSIARAFYRDAEVLILDEPSASLDPQAEAEIFKQIATLSLNKMAIFITHRLGSVHMADRILVLKKGRVVETGFHEQLLENRGEYARLYKVQASKYTDKKLLKAMN